MLKDRLAEDLKEAMRARDEVRLRTIRMLRAALQSREIEERPKGAGELTEQVELAVVQKQAKQRREAIAEYEKAGREDLAAKEREELVIVEGYLPQALGDDEIRGILQEVIAATGASSPREQGKVMGPALQRMAGRADGKRVSEIARELLSGGS